jgi:tellurite resistance protein
MRAECTNPLNDGFVTWGTKQELYKLKWLVDESLAACSNYAGEEEWLKEQEQQRIINILKNED